MLEKLAALKNTNYGSEFQRGKTLIFFKNRIKNFDWPCVRFGHKFGFSVRGIKPLEKKKVYASLRERIQDLKMICGSNKSEEFLKLKLKLMGIDVMNLEIDDETIIDLIKQFVYRKRFTIIILKY